MRKFIFLWIVIVELAVIAFLAGKIYLESSQVLGENISINPISKDDVIFPNQDNESDLKNFYEPKPNTSRINKAGWLPSDYGYTVTINADSLNERFDYPTEKDADVFRIVTLGDSYTFGLYVNTQENYPERLEDMLNDDSLCKTTKKFEVINLGVGGYDIEYSVHRFKARGQKYNPDLILWLLKNDDFTTINELIKPKIDQYRQEMSTDSALLAQLRSEGNFWPWSKKAVQELKAELGEEKVLDYSKKALKRINDYYKGNLVFITSSGWLDAPYLAMLTSFINGRSNTYLYDGLALSFDHFEDWHPTGQGYAQIAASIFDYLTQSGIIPCGLP